MLDQNACISPEDRWKFAEKIEGIFVPRILKSRLSVYPHVTSPPAKFVHYTTADAALNIIKSKSIWMRNAMVMPDYRELHHGYNVLTKFFNTPENGKPLLDAVDAYAMGAATEALIKFNSWWEQIQLNTFVASVSEHHESENNHGRLSMWRAFGSSPARVALVFKFPSLSPAPEKLNFLFSPVVYLTDSERQDLIPEVIENLKREKEFVRTLNREKIIDYLFYMLRSNVTCLKHEGFREEKEWRVVHCPPLDGVTKTVTHDVISVSGVPQLICKIALDGSGDPDLAHIDLANALDSLIIGPSPYPKAMSGAFIQALDSIGVKDSNRKIRYSEIPIRS